MKKTLSLLLALVMVIGLFPVFADEAPALTAEEAGAVLQGYGAIKGDSNGDLMIDKELKRQDAVVILTRLMGKDKEVEAMPKETKASFEDITIDYYQPFLAFAESNKWIEGKAEKKFGFNDVVTVKEFSAMLLRALGHDTMGENYAKVMDLAKEQGLFKGAMVEENANLVRGIAFILMNNTLETAPKGEDKALVYKLGYKEEPKPENLTVVSAEAAGLKAIDIKFSKAVSEKSLENAIKVKDGNKNVDAKVTLLDEMTARVLLTNKAKQDAKYTVTVDGVKSADMMEAVEKYEAAIFMTDATRPEVLSVEALNPKTLVVKTSEPIDKATMNSFASMKEFKIEGKALTAKVVNANKNEIVVELYSALKAGDYKIEVSSLKDYAGFIAKTAEFDFTVVEDKDAPVVTEAVAESTTLVKVTFNEPVYEKGQFKVNGKTIVSSKIAVDKDDKRIVRLTVEELGMGAIVEVKVEHKGQKDIMGNMVKDWTTFTFKVEDDTTLPEVKSVITKEIDGKVNIVVTFSKNMNNKEGKYTLKKGSETKIAKKAVTVDQFKELDTLTIDVDSILKNQNAADYTIILEGFKDGTVRKNEMPKVEQTLSASDYLAPEAVGFYAYTKVDGKYYQAHVYFTEEMDEATLVELKNYTLKSYGEAGDREDTRADFADVSISVLNSGKEILIEVNNDKKDFESIIITGLKDKAGNYIKAETEVKKHNVSNKQVVKEAKLIKEEDKYKVVVKVKNPIEVMGNSMKLKFNTEYSDLTLESQDATNTQFTFVIKNTTVNSETLYSDATYDGGGVNFLKLEKSGELGDANKSVDNFGNNLQDADELVNGGLKQIKLEDKVAPSVTKTGEKFNVSYDTADGKVVIEFNEKMKAAEYQVVEVTDELGNVQVGTVALDVSEKKVEITITELLKNGNYTVNIKKAIDKAGNEAEIGTLELKVDEKAAKFVEIQDFTGNVNLGEVTLTLDHIIEYGKKADGTAFKEDDAEVKSAFKVIRSDDEAGNSNPEDYTSKVTKASINGNEVTITFGASTNVQTGKFLTIEFDNTNKVFVEKANGIVVENAKLVKKAQ